MVSVLSFLAHLAIVVGLSIRVIMRRRPVGISLAWIVVLVTVPLVGAVLYALIGENPLGARRRARMDRILQAAAPRVAALDHYGAVNWAPLSPACEALHRQAVAAIGFPALPGNELELIGDSDEVLRAIIADLDRAEHTCHMQFYIWSAGGRADEVVDALLRAAARGVTCRVLLDAVGSREFLGGAQAERLLEGGVRLVEALPVGLVRTFFDRIDLRNHRKIVVIDGEVAYTGSMNLADPRCFKQSAGVGQWVDAMVRVRGPAVEALGLTFLLDWELETGEKVETLERAGDLRQVPERGPSVVQVVPSGPGSAPDAIHEMLVATIYAARSTLVMTTPYFVPDVAMLSALKTAAQRGVEVTIVVPEKVDSLLVRYAAPSFFDDLLAAGARVALYRENLLHAKTITVDGEFGVIGSVNLDMRSFWIDFEVTLFVYDPAFTGRLRMLQAGYLAQSDPLEGEYWGRRTPLRRFAENAARLASPLL